MRYLRGFCGREASWGKVTGMSRRSGAGARGLQLEALRPLTQGSCSLPGIYWRATAVVQRKEGGKSG